MPIIRREELRLQYASGAPSKIYLDNHKSRSVWNTVGGNFSGKTVTESPKLIVFFFNTEVLPTMMRGVGARARAAPARSPDEPFWRHPSVSLSGSR